jgi:hypothetical protein
MDFDLTDAVAKSIFRVLLKGLTPLPLDSSASEKLKSDSKRCRTNVRQDIIMTRNAPSLSRAEFGNMKGELDGEQPICAICLQDLKRPDSIPASVWDTRDDLTPVKLVVAEDMDPSAQTNANLKTDKTATPSEGSKVAVGNKLRISQSNSSTPHAFHLACIRSWFFDDEDTEMNQCPTC